MQVKIETSKGEVLCVLLPSGLKSYKLIDDMGDNLLDIRSQTKWTSISLDKGFKIIDPLSEVTEEQAKMMVQALGRGDCYKNYSDKLGNAFGLALDSFKSLMQANEVYEVNPRHKPTHNEVLIKGDKWKWYAREYKRLESRSGNWIILFKEK